MPAIGEIAPKRDADGECPVWSEPAAGTKVARRLDLAVVSMGQRNTLAKSLGWGFEVQRFSWPLVEPTRDPVEFGLGVRRRIGSSWEVLAQKPVGVFV